MIILPTMRGVLRKAPPSLLMADYLIVGGGASGGGYVGGGGGAGGVRDSAVLGPVELEPGTYPIVVGLGGAAAANGSGVDGQDGGLSSAFGIEAPGGGGGGGYSNRNGRPGASGGGGGSWSSGGGLGTPGLGHNGSPTNSGVNSYGGGGGGAGGAGNGPVAGAGITSSITGAALRYARGGPAGSYNEGAYPYPDGTRRPGDGGRGGGNAGMTTGSDAGQNGEVIIAYEGPPLATGGIITEVGGWTIHRFTASGDFVVA